MTDHTDDNLDRIDKALENLALEDAPDHLVQSTLERVRATPFSEPIRHRSRTWANGLAAAVVAVAAVGIIYQQLPIYREPESPLIADDRVLVSSKTDEELVQFAFKRVDELREAGNRPEAASETERAFDGARYREQDRQEHAEGYATRNFDSSQRALSPRKDAMGKSVGEISSVSDDARANEIGAFRYESKKLSAAVDRPVVQQGDFDASFDDNFALENLNSRELLLLEPSTSVLPNSHQKAVAAQSPARDSFVARYRNMDGLSYQQASGYWANTY
ncbi:MAG: hypothetical protein O7B25_01280, partial [Gammaproteobacteria bacterium]|nr:hypothetical protein [Gammaproteobacteria bacterium]